VRNPDLAEFSGAFALFKGDAFDRIMAKLRLGNSDRPRPFRRSLALVGLAWAPLFVTTAWSGNLVGPSLRESFILDLASYAQLVAYIPLSVFGEVYIEWKMSSALRRLTALVDTVTLSRLTAWSTRLSRSRLAGLVTLVLAYVFTLAWARDEVNNGLPSWHTAVDGNGREGFTFAGYWVVIFSLPLFTFLWLRWAYKVFVWTKLLYRLSHYDLRIIPTHPDRTGGLACLSDVQTSFAILLFGTGIQFSAFLLYKIVLEGNALSDPTVWGPALGYSLLAPAVFLAPLFLFTRRLARARDQALERFQNAGVLLSKQFERRWLKEASDHKTDLLDDQAPSVVADFKAAWETVSSMRIVPFDLRSLTELVGASAAPFAPLLWIAKLPDKIKAFIELVS
jgi:hypothetical protein